MSVTEATARDASKAKNRLSLTGQLWILAVLLPALTYIGRNMCIWTAPRFLGSVALMLLSVADVTVFFFVAALPASVYFLVVGLLRRRTDGQLVRGLLNALACLCFVVLWILASISASSPRHRAFVRASWVGDGIVQALARYRSKEGEYPESLDRLIPGYLARIPYTGMIAYPDWAYHKDRNDLETKPGAYELRINCTSGGINFDRFIYWPSEVYPNRIQGNGVERIRSWAYVHE